MTSTATCRRSACAAGLAALLLSATPLAAVERDFGPDAPASMRGTKLPAADAPEPRDLAVQGGAAAPQDTPAMKVIPESFADAIGTWDLSLEGSNNRCQLVLSSENSRNGRIVRFPAGCRRGLPVLANAVGWLFADGGIRLVDKDIRPLLKFSASKDRSSLTAKADSGATYALVPLQTMAMLPPSPDAASAAPSADPKAATAPPTPEAAIAAALRSDTPAGESRPAEIQSSAREIPGSQPVLAAGTLVPSQAVATSPQPMPVQAGTAKEAAATTASAGPVPGPGVYALDRFSEKDVCRLELGASRVGGRGDKDIPSAARILPGCRDSGITVFDPVSWRFANGHMTLKAKRGHAVNLVAAGDGSWRRDPDVGTTFVLRKVEP